MSSALSFPYAATLPVITKVSGKTEHYETIGAVVRSSMAVLCS